MFSVLHCHNLRVNEIVYEFRSIYKVIISRLLNSELDSQFSKSFTHLGIIFLIQK